MTPFLIFTYCTLYIHINLLTYVTKLIPNNNNTLNSSSNLIMHTPHSSITQLEYYSALNSHKKAFNQTNILSSPERKLKKKEEPLIRS